MGNNLDDPRQVVPEHLNFVRFTVHSIFIVKPGSLSTQSLFSYLLGLTSCIIHVVIFFIKHARTISAYFFCNASIHNLFLNSAQVNTGHVSVLASWSKQPLHTECLHHSRYTLYLYTCAPISHIHVQYTCIQWVTFIFRIKQSFRLKFRLTVINFGFRLGLKLFLKHFLKPSFKPSLKPKIICQTDQLLTCY